METKHEVFARFDALCRRDAILATNTSALNIDLIADAIRRPAQVVGLHFFSPAQGTKVIEVVRTERTASPVVAASMRLAKDLGNFGVLVRVGEGFVGSRMFHEYQREANVLLHEGAPREHVDAAMADFGMATGPLATLDQTDTDEVETVTVEASKAAGVEPRAIGQLEIVERCLFAMINEGARILDEGIALRASDIDVIWVDGYGFPRHRGGPMYHADRLGLSEIHDRLRRLAREHGEHWTASPLLARLAREGRAFGTT